MKIVYSRLIPFKGYKAINLFGTLIVREEYRNRITRTDLNHEAIHTEQMKETFYIGFYILYFIFWLIRLLSPPLDTAYLDISFEQEAYLHQSDLSYIKKRKPYSWMTYQFTSYRKSQEKTLI